MILTGNLSDKNASVLILNRIHQPVLAHQNGEITRQLMVNFDQDTSAGGSCSLVWKNEFHIFGGNLDSTKTQISKLDSCMLKRIGDLDFEFENGACTNFDSQRIFLCFSYDDTKRCRYASNAKDFSYKAGYTKVEFFSVFLLGVLYFRSRKVSTNIV